jgi:hypothetical protein
MDNQDINSEFLCKTLQEHRDKVKTAAREAIRKEDICKAHADALDGLLIGVQTIIFRLDVDRADRHTRQRELEKERKDTFWKMTGIVVTSSGIIAGLVTHFMR